MVDAIVAGHICLDIIPDLSGSVQSWDETWQRVRNGWGRHELAMNTPGWVLNEQQQLWVGPGGN